MTQYIDITNWEPNAIKKYAPVPIIKRNPLPLKPLPHDIEKAENIRLTRSSTEMLAEAAAERARRMEWRIKRYGYACLTFREFEACNWEAQYKRGEVKDVDEARLKWIAGRMCCTPQNISQLLISASNILQYFDDQDIPFYFERIGGMWRLHAPIAPAMRLNYIQNMQEFAS